MTDATIGELTIPLEDDPGDIITEVVILARVQRLDEGPGRSALILGTTDNVDTIMALGLIHQALNVITQGDAEEDTGP